MDVAMLSNWWGYWLPQVFEPDVAQTGTWYQRSSTTCNALPVALVLEHLEHVCPESTDAFPMGRLFHSFDDIVLAWYS